LSVSAEAAGLSRDTGIPAGAVESACTDKNVCIRSLGTDKNVCVTPSERQSPTAIGLSILASGLDATKFLFAAEVAFDLAGGLCFNVDVKSPTRRQLLRLQS